MNDPVNSYLAYLFTFDKSPGSEIFGVFKMDFSSETYSYVYTKISMSSVSTFSVNSIIRISMTDSNDFLFAGKA